jgi:hypothetical protein
VNRKRAARLTSKGWRSGSAADFLRLSAKERLLVEQRLSRAPAPRSATWLEGVNDLADRLAQKYGPMPNSVEAIQELRDRGPR